MLTAVTTSSTYRPLRIKKKFQHFLTVLAVLFSLNDIIRRLQALPQTFLAHTFYLKEKPTTEKTDKK